jgi:nucleoside 2-deoxyribosyltransferase
MKIVVSGSMSAYDEMVKAKNILENNGHQVTIPDNKNIKNELDENGNSIESAHIKIKDDLIRAYYELIKNSDIVLAVNPDKKGITGYIGGATFLELGFGHALNKKLYILNPYSKQLTYHDEITAMQPTIINGDLDLI